MKMLVVAQMDYRSVCQQAAVGQRQELAASRSSGRRQEADHRALALSSPPPKLKGKFQAVRPTVAPGQLRVPACGWSGAGQLMTLTSPASTAFLGSTWSTARTAAACSRSLRRSWNSRSSRRSFSTWVCRHVHRRVRLLAATRRKRPAACGCPASTVHATRYLGPLDSAASEGSRDRWQRACDQG